MPKYVTHDLLKTLHLDVNVHYGSEPRCDETIHFWYSDNDDGIEPFYAQFVNGKISMATFYQDTMLNVYFDSNGKFDPDLNITEPNYI